MWSGLKCKTGSSLKKKKTVVDMSSINRDFTHQGVDPEEKTFHHFNHFTFSPQSQNDMILRI